MPNDTFHETLLTFGAIGHQPSASAHRPSAFGHLPSAISLRPSAIGHQPSAISLRPSAISLLKNELKHYLASTLMTASPQSKSTSLIGNLGDSCLYNIWPSIPKPIQAKGRESHIDKTQEKGTLPSL
ncbi:hypothetical protein ACE6H2_026629 [Prunus campanulata]